MATYFVSSSGSNTSPYDTWAKAATSLQTALTAASANGDIVVIQHNGVPSVDAELAADTTYWNVNNRYLIVLSASNDGGSNYTPTPMGAANWIGNSTTNRSIFFGNATDSRIYAYGLTLRIAGSTADAINLASGSGSALVFESGYLWCGNTAAGGLTFGNNSGGSNSVILRNTAIRFGAAANTLQSNGGLVRFETVTIAPEGSAPSVLVTSFSPFEFLGCDLSFVTGTLVANMSQAVTHTFSQCKLGAGVTPLAAQTSNPTASSAKAVLYDCSTGDTHGLFGYYDALGQVESNTSIYQAAGSAGQSWKIDTAANATPLNPFQTPWIGRFTSSTAPVTPSFQILRNGSATAYTNAQVWGEFSAKVTAGTVMPTIYSDRQSLAALLAGTAAADQSAGAGLAAWTGESGTAWSGEIDSGAAITPAESGHIRGRVVVGAPSVTVYVTPAIDL